jgi:hypothetical protein
MTDRLTWLRIASVLGLGVALAGCAAGGGWVAGAFALMAVAGVALSGCSSSHTTGRDSGAEMDAGDAIDAGGRWERCCVEGSVDSCFCPAGWACNYGWFEDCGDGTCIDPGSEDVCSGDGGVDAGPDAGGTFEPCCVAGHIDTCFCPAGAECNYGFFEDCGDGTCTDPGSMCPAADAGAPVLDAGGHWDPCCVDGALTTCHCPAGVICNYWYTDCGDGTCTTDPAGGCAS